MVAAGDDARTARRAQRRGVHVGEAHAVGGEPIEVRRLDRAAIAAELAEPGVIQHHEQHVRCARRRPHRRRPRRCRLVRRPPDPPGKRGARRILDDRHAVLLISRDWPVFIVGVGELRLAWAGADRSFGSHGREDRRTGCLVLGRKRGRRRRSHEDVAAATAIFQSPALSQVGSGAEHHTITGQDSLGPVSTVL